MNNEISLALAFLFIRVFQFVSYLFTSNFLQKFLSISHFLFYLFHTFYFISYHFKSFIYLLVLLHMYYFLFFICLYILRQRLTLLNYLQKKYRSRIGTRRKWNQLFGDEIRRGLLQTSDSKPLLDEMKCYLEVTKGRRTSSRSSTVSVGRISNNYFCNKRS